MQVGHSRLEIPGAFIGKTVAADWYFPTQVDGTVDAQGVIWLQHGFGATNTFYSALATDLAQRTNSIVVAPTLSSLPFTFSGGCLICATSQEAAAEAFLDPNRTALTDSALAAGYTGDVSELLGMFVLAGHSAGGGFATATAADYVTAGTATGRRPGRRGDVRRCLQRHLRRHLRRPDRRAGHRRHPDLSDRRPRAGVEHLRRHHQPAAGRPPRRVQRGWCWWVARTSTPCWASTR